MCKAINGSATGKWLIWLLGLYLALVGMASPAHAAAIKAAAGDEHSLAVGTNGKLYAWGLNSYGQLGLGASSTSDRNSPVLVGLPTGVGAVSVAAGAVHSLAIGSDGKLYAWGTNLNGELGDGSMTIRTAPVQVNLPSGVTALSVAAGNDHSLAIGSDGKLYAWGANSDGQLGDGSTTNRTAPVQVSLPSGVMATSVAAGYNHSFATGSDGKLYAWGDNWWGQLGDGSTTGRSTPVQVNLPTGVSATRVATGQGHSLAIGSDGKLYAWGDNPYGQLGDGSTSQHTTPVQVDLPAGVTATSVAAGAYHSLAIGSNGKLYAWGYNFNGQLGDGSTTQRNTPVLVSLPTGVGAGSVAADSAHSLAFGSDSNLYAWGWNRNGQLGDGSNVDRHTPVLVSLPAEATASGSNADTTGDVPLPPWSYAALALLLLGSIALQRHRT